MKDAKSISLNIYYNGIISYNNSKNFYKFTLNTSGRVKMNLNSQMGTIYWKVYDSNGDEIWGSSAYYDSNRGELVISETVFIINYIIINCSF